MSEQRTMYEPTTDQLSARQVEQIRDLLWAAFAGDEDGAFTEEDWQHSIGGVHFLAVLGGEIVAHASVVERTLHVRSVPIRTGYVEAVATRPDVQGRGHGTAVMRRVNDHLEDRYDLGALGTGSQGFYERLGWQIWRGPSSVLVEGRDYPTPDEDGYIMVLVTQSTPPITLDAPIACEWRAGDVW